jgi:hypothetical protein
MKSAIRAGGALDRARLADGRRGHRHDEGQGRVPGRRYL